MLVHIKTLVLIFITIGSFCDGLKILGLFPHPGKSHFDVFKPVLKALAERGHEMTVVSYFPLESPRKNYKDIILSGEIYLNIVDINALLGRWYEPFMLAKAAKAACENGLSSSEMKTLIGNKVNVSFDLIMMEYFNTDCFAGFAYKFDVPIIGMTSCVILPWTNDRFGNPDNPAYIPNVIHGLNDNMSFMDRLENTIMTIYSKSIYSFYIDRFSDVIAKQYFGDDLPPLQEIVYNYTRLFLVNTHFSLNLPRPLVPAVIETGGVYLGTPKKLPKNIEKWINESTHGVIYFSLGSMIKGHTFPEEKRQIFLRAFARLPQRVLWKWENDTMPGKPDNVMTQKWMPQFDILCHPNVRAFISHGGLLGTTEAVHCGVPAIVMPQFGDQYTNAKAWEANGGAVIMELGSVTDERLQEALQKVLDPKFREQAKELSARYRDRPMSPLDTAIYWVEYVARHKGAPFLRTAAVGMPFYKYLLLDVIAFLLLVLAIIVYVNYLFWRMILRKLFGKGQKVKTN